MRDVRRPGQAHPLGPEVAGERNMAVFGGRPRERWGRM